MAYQMDFFAGIESKVLAAIGDKVQYPAYVFVRDEESSATGRLAFVDQNNVLKYIRGENKQQVLNVAALPDVSEGDVEVLYIFNGVVYVFDGTEYKAMYKDNTAELEALVERMNELEESSKDFDSQVSGLETEITSINEQIASLEEKLNAIEMPEGCKCGAKYEITDVPVGTLVDYRDSEIRIMCPVNTEWTKQNVGAGGDANCYYLTFKTYAPSDDIVGYIEHLGNQVDEEILNTFSTDADGRRYQPTWLSLAKYDESTDTWTYYGANSSKEHYIGWDYQIDWYNADGVMVKSDCVRINLSNEECHFVIEPYYIAAVKAEVETLKESNADVVEKLATMTEQVTEIEERVEIVEKETLTFVELE